MNNILNKDRLISELLNWRYAHRGFHSKPYVPENSMSAFNKAVSQGFGMEIDVHITSDGKLAVIHDASLKRTCGVDLIIEHITLAEAQKYPLEKSDERIPEFKDVLKAVDGKTPLIIELKVGKYEDGSPAYVDLCEAMCRALEGYEGIYCIESFDPAPVKWFAENRPDIVRGQLAADLNKDGKEHPWYVNFLVKTLLVNVAGKPDFVAYDVRDKHLLRGKSVNGSAIKFEKSKDKKRGFPLANWNGPLFFWTVKSWEDMKAAEEKGIACIFENFNPNEYEG